LITGSLDRLDLGIFFSWFAKVFVFNGLRGEDRTGSRQNLEPLGLTWKILSNNDLAALPANLASPSGE
jgi:hypothetical protein